jgi:hypothetical protein
LRCFLHSLVFVVQLTVVPANERTQGRWNGDPYDLVGGSGFIEMDPGAWLLPYWLARHYGLIGG